MRKSEEERLYDYINKKYKIDRRIYMDGLVIIRTKEENPSRKLIYNKEDNSLIEIVKKHNNTTVISVKNSNGITYATIDNEKNPDVLNYQIDTELSLTEVLIGLKGAIKVKKANQKIQKKLKKIEIIQNQISSKIDNDSNEDYSDLANKLYENQIQKQKIMKKIIPIPYENDLSSVVKK